MLLSLLARRRRGTERGTDAGMQTKRRVVWGWQPPAEQGAKLVGDADGLCCAACAAVGRIREPYLLICAGATIDIPVRATAASTSVGHVPLCGGHRPGAAAEGEREEDEQHYANN